MFIARLCGLLKPDRGECKKVKPLSVCGAAKTNEPVFARRRRLRGPQWMECVMWMGCQRPNVHVRSTIGYMAGRRMRLYNMNRASRVCVYCVVTAAAAEREPLARGGGHKWANIVWKL